MSTFFSNAARAFFTKAKLIETVKNAGGTDTEICMELSFREREPTDSTVVDAIRESVAFWEPHIDTGFNGR